MRLAAAAAAVLTVAIAGFALPAAPVYDAWSWLVWGRELADGALDTSAGPSWKPLTVFLAVPVSAAGADAPEIWLLLSRIAWLAVPLACAALALRLADGLGVGGWQRGAAVVLAGLGAVLIFDPETAWIRQGLGGLSEPLVASLLAASLERALAGRHEQALALGLAIALLRPEAWPIGAVYLLWLWPRERRTALAGATLFGLVALAWTVPDLIGAANPVEGPVRARSGAVPDSLTALRALGYALILAPLALLAGAAAAIFRGRRIGVADAAVVAAVAIGWTAIVVAMAFVGFAGLARFSAPAAALVCALGGAGLGYGLQRLCSDSGFRLPRAALVIAAAALVADLGVRGALAVSAVDRMADFERETVALERLLADVRAPRCTPVTTNALLFDPAIAWQLDRHLREVGAFDAAQGGLAVIRGGEDLPDELGAALAGAQPIADQEGWDAFELACRSAGAAQAPTP